MSMSMLTEQLEALAQASARQVDRTVAAGGACVKAPDPEAWFTDEPETRAEARAECHACPVQLACLERGLRLETTASRNGLLPLLHGLLAGLEPDEREPLRDMRRDRHTPADRAMVVPKLAAELHKRGWTDPHDAGPADSETGGGVDDTASRRPHGQGALADREALLADLQAEHYGTTPNGVPTRDAAERDAAHELHARARRARCGDHDRYDREEVRT